MAAGENVAMRTELPGGGVHGVDRQGVVTKIRYVGIARDSSSYSSDDDKVSGAGTEPSGVVAVILGRPIE